MDYADVDPYVMRAAISELAARYRVAGLMGDTYDGKRNLSAAFGYKDPLTVNDYRFRYERGGIAGRIVDAPAKATWRGGVEPIEDDDETTLTPFEEAWWSLQDRLALTTAFEATDILSRLSTFAVLFIGAPGEVEDELPRGNGTPDGIMYLTPYCGQGEGINKGRRTFYEALQGIDQADAIVDSFDEDPRSPRFGLPKGYRLRRTGFESADKFSTRVVHWSRLTHVAEGCLDDRVFTQPALKRVWNYLDDLEKVAGGGAEAFFQRVKPSRVWNLDKDVTLDEPAKQEVRTQIEELQHNIISDIRTKGIDVKTLDPATANFANQVDAIVTLIAGAIGMPKRILTGSEMGELASSQDRDNWRDQVNGRRQQHADPNIFRAFNSRLIAYNYLPAPKKPYVARWGSVLNLTEDEKRQKMQGMATTNQALKGSGQPPAFLTNEIRAVDERAPYTVEEIEAERELLPEPVVQPASQFPRAASAHDEAVVERLAAAIEAGDTKTIDKIVGITHAD